VARVIGLTGGIGSGKSTVAALLAARGAVVIDADRVAHEVYAPGTPGFRRIVDRFGQRVVGPDGGIDRKRLAATVFADSVALRDLNAIVHPVVHQEIARRIAAAVQENPEGVVVIEAALMTETGWKGGASELWAVVVEPNIAVERLVRDRAMTEDEARARIATQATNEARRAAATVVIENDGSVFDLETTIERLWRARVAGS
jgi:dephospho-CoA kinase